MATTSEDKKPRKALGKGLGALIPTTKSDGEGKTFFSCDVGRIRANRDQPRKSFAQEALEELAASIKQSGLIQPLVVRQLDDGKYELIAGERRWRACQLAGIKEVPVVVKDLSDDDAFVVALIENIQREDLNPLEEAQAYRRLVDEFSHTQQSVAERVGKSRSAVANSLRLLNLSPKIQDMVADGQLSAGHARNLVSMKEEEALELADVMVKHGFSVREAEELVRETKNGTKTKKSSSKSSRYRDDANVRDIAEKLQEALGTKVTLKDLRGKGRIEIHYDDYDVLQAVLERIIDVE